MSGTNVQDAVMPDRSVPYLSPRLSDRIGSTISLNSPKESPMRFQRNMGPKERALRVVASAAFFVVGATVLSNHIQRGVFFLLGLLALIAAITGYGPFVPYFRRLRGGNQGMK
jgi:hypothetical protein